MKNLLFVLCLLSFSTAKAQMQQVDSVTAKYLNRSGYALTKSADLHNRALAIGGAMLIVGSVVTATAEEPYAGVAMMGAGALVSIITQVSACVS